MYFFLVGERPFTASVFDICPMRCHNHVFEHCIPVAYSGYKQGSRKDETHNIYIMWKRVIFAQCEHAQGSHKVRTRLKRAMGSHMVDTRNKSNSLCVCFHVCVSCVCNHFRAACFV